MIRYELPTFNNTVSLVKSPYYNISVDELMHKYRNENLTQIEIQESIMVELTKLVRKGIIWFPFQRYFRGNPHELFENLKHIDLPINCNLYRLYSYYPQHGSFLPPRFRGKSIVVAGTRGTYGISDVLSDHFIEDKRLKAKRYDQDRSILESWADDFHIRSILTAVLEKSHIRPMTLRDSIYETIPETKIFNPTWAKALLKLVIGENLEGLKWLDISSGWGDRLLLSMVLKMKYLGFDPNVELKEGHSNMIKEFGDPKFHKVIYEAFENATIIDGPYDVVLTSPPYFILEKYVDGQIGQSIVTYPEFNQWMVRFLFASLSKAWNHLKIGGYLILHLGDAKTIATSEAANIFIENYLPGSSWEGVIGLQGEAGYPRPVWVWKKVSLDTRRKIWEPQSIKLNQRGPLKSSQRTLYTTYPSLHSELLQFYAENYAPNYPIHKFNISAIRSHINNNSSIVDDLMIFSLLQIKDPQETITLCIDIDSGKLTEINAIIPQYSIRKTNVMNIYNCISLRLPHVSKHHITNILHDNIMILCLLEILNIKRTILWGVAMIKLSLHV